ncbi:MAG: hypothetical protein K5756_00170 [Clostridiales bacterium]|nr:hypothetical protein [Clostridiales bacterium]
MKKVLSLLLILLMFISVISPTVFAVGSPVCSANTAVEQNINHPALWGGNKPSPSRRSSTNNNQDDTFDGRIILIVVVALLGIIVSTALILLNIKYIKIRKEEEAEELRKKGLSPASAHKSEDEKDPGKAKKKNKVKSK